MTEDHVNNPHYVLNINNPLYHKMKTSTGKLGSNVDIIYSTIIMTEDNVHNPHYMLGFLP